MRANVYYISHQTKCKTTRPNSSPYGLDGQTSETKQNSKGNQDNSGDVFAPCRMDEGAVNDRGQNSAMDDQTLRDSPPVTKCKSGPIQNKEEESKENNYSATFTVIRSMLKNLVSSGPALLRPIVKSAPQSVEDVRNQEPQDLEHDRHDSDKENIPPAKLPSALSKPSFAQGERRILVSRGQVLLLPNGHESRKKLNGPVHAIKKLKYSPEVSKTVMSKLPATGDPIEMSPSTPRLNNKQLRRSTRCEHGLRNTCASLTQMYWYFELLEEHMIRRFLEADVCRRYADKYLLAMVFTYFVRSQFEQEQFTKKNFFAALYLAHDMEEDLEELKYEVFPWALGHRWHHTFSTILQLRDDIFWKIDCRATVSRKCCEQVMDMAPHHWVWKRERPFYHGGAVREHLRHPTDNGHPRGPYKSPLQCQKCLEHSCLESDNSYLLYDEAEADMSCSEKASDGDENEDSGFQTMICNQSDVGTSLLQAEKTGTSKSSPPQKKSVLVRDCLSLPRANYKSNVSDSDSSSASDLAVIHMETCEITAVGNDLEGLPHSQADTVMVGFVSSQEI